MANDIDFEDTAPVIPVLDLDVALDRCRRLGFSVHAYEGLQRYGFAERAGCRYT